MVNSQELKEKATELLNEQVLSVGIFEASVVAHDDPEGEDRVNDDVTMEEKQYKRNASYNLTAAFSIPNGLPMFVDGFKRKQLNKNNNTDDEEQRQQQPKIIVCAVTETKVYLLDWNQDNGGDGEDDETQQQPQILEEFDRDFAEIKCQKANLFHMRPYIEITEENVHAKIKCNLNDSTREVMTELKAHATATASIPAPEDYFSMELSV